VIRSYKAYKTLPASIRSVLAGLENLPGASILGVVPIEDQKTTKIFKDHDCRVVHTAVPDITRQANAGFAAADTEFVQVFDSDDIMYPNMSTSCFYTGGTPEAVKGWGLEGIRQDIADVIYTDYEMWSGKDFLQPVQCIGVLNELDVRCFIPELCVFRREPWVKLGGFDETLWRYAQWDYFLRLRNNGGRFMRLPFFGFRYVLSDQQLSRRIDKGEFNAVDDPAWEKFRAKHGGMPNAVTVGHGARMRQMEDVVT